MQERICKTSRNVLANAIFFERAADPQKRYVILSKYFVIVCSPTTENEFMKFNRLR